MSTAIRTFLIAGVLGLLVALPLEGHFPDARSAFAGPTTISKHQLKAAAAAAKSVNGLCPVMGRLVTAKGGSATYKGERIAFCCPGCIAKFDGDPTRYMDLMRLNAPKYWYASRLPSVVAMRKAKQKVRSSNGRCPVMGKVVVAKGGYSSYQGQVIQFCCPPCKPKFDADPDRFLRLMRADPLAYAYDRPGPTNAQMRAARESAGASNGRCPVMGKAVTVKGGAVTYQGQRIGFCCPPCVAKFRKNPEAYMNRMRTEPAVYGYVTATR